MVHLDVPNRIVAQGHDVARRLNIALAQVVERVLGILRDLLGVPTKFVKLRLDLLSLLIVHFAPFLDDLTDTPCDRDEAESPTGLRPLSEI